MNSTDCTRFLRCSLAVLGLWLVGCDRAQLSGPPTLRLGRDECAACGMIIDEERCSSALLVERNGLREHLAFDDIGCIAHYLAAAASLPRGAVVYVADHRTKAWVRADRATYTRVPGLATPMGSHIVAHESAASRDQDVDLRDGMPVGMEELFGAAAPGRGGPRP